MASFFSDSTSSKANSRSDWRGKVRIVAKIRASNDLETQSSNGVSAPWISVRKPEGESSDCVTISFGDQSTSRKDSYKLDYCYQQDEDVTQIFSREVKPLISGVFDGLNASILAYGARGSGKTYLIQGSEEKPGLAPLALAEVLSIAENTESSVAVSCYEVYQDHIYDLLEHSRQEISILEDALGRIKLKGLSQVPVKSLVELYKLYFHGSTSHKPAHKAKNEVLRRSHKGLIIHVSSKNRDSGSSTVGKINFVDLAGYEDTKRKSIDGYNFVDSTWINMSLYTLQNVVKALNARERVPYRESKLTRMLQDSLGGRNQTLMVTCLNPSFCQDTIYTVSLASQSCQVLNQVSCDSTKKIKNVARIMPLPSPNAARRQTLSNSVKRHNNSQLHVTQKKTNSLLSTPKGRKLFDGANNAMSSLQEKLLVDIAPTIAPSLSNEEKLLVDTAPAIEPSPSNEEKLLVDIAPTIAPSLSNEEKLLVDTAPAMEPSPSNEEHSVSSAILDIQPSQTVKSEMSESTIDGEMDLNLIHKEEQSFPVVNTETKSFTVPKEDCNLEKENNLFINSNRSPPLSERLRELSNSLKSLCSTTPLGIERPQKVDSNITQDCSYPEEPKTPTVESCTFVKNRETPMETPSFCSPWETYSVMSSGLKQALAQQYLKFLNSGSKEELKGLKGIGEKRASYILELREESPEPFKDLDDLKAIGLSTKQIKGMMKKFAGDLF